MLNTIVDFILPWVLRSTAVVLAAIQLMPGVFNVPVQSLRLQPNRQHQTFEGFGTSMAWWAQHIDDEDLAREIARALYCRDTGLGLDIFRFNVGAGERDNPNSRIYGWFEWRRAYSFYYNGALDFTRDANAMRMLDLAMEYGATQMILFAKSPHFTHTNSGHASGGLVPYYSNHNPVYYQAFVDYMLDIADWFVAQGYPVTAIAPINEPQWGWGGDWVGQEGCFYTPAEAVELMELFALEMQRRGSPFALHGLESGYMGETEYIDAFFGSEILRDFVDVYAGHSYWIGRFGRWRAGRRMQRRYPDIRFEMSEWCELPLLIDSTTIDSGIYKANVIIQDLTLLHAVSWQSWIAVNEDGVMNLKVPGQTHNRPDFINGELVFYNRYWAFMHFTRFIQPGAVRIGVRDNFWLGSQIASVAFEQDGEIVLVLVNNAERDQSIRLPGEFGHMRMYTTCAEQNMAQVHDGIFGGRVTLPGRSINTIVLRAGDCPCHG